MREILFRGRRIDNDNEEWVEGGIIDCKQRGLFIAVHHPDYADAMDAHRYGSSYSVPVEVTRFFKIDPSTLCQFTGLHDKNGVRIWEGDILKWTRKDIVLCETNYQRNPYGYGDILVVRSFASGYTLTTMTNNSDIPNVAGNIGNYNLWNYQRAFVVIGSIHDKERS